MQIEVFKRKKISSGYYPGILVHDYQKIHQVKEATSKSIKIIKSIKSIKIDFTFSKDFLLPKLLPPFVSILNQLI